MLKQAYEAINASGKHLEIVFVSSDHDVKQFEVLHRLYDLLATCMILPDWKQSTRLAQMPR